MWVAKDTPAPGNWMGIYYRYYPSTGSAFEYVTFEYAGAQSGATGFGCGPSDNDATILILNQRPDDAWVKNSTFRFGGGDETSTVGRARTIPGAGSSPTRLRAAFCSCQSYANGYYGAWRGIAEQDVDFVLFLGDYIYEYAAKQKAAKLDIGCSPIGTIAQLRQISGVVSSARMSVRKRW